MQRALLRLLEGRGLTLTSSYQVNLGGTEDFRNLAENGSTKHQSKLNALAAEGPAAGRVQVAPPGYLPHLQSHKVAHINIEARAWGETPVSVDVKLKVHDPSGAAGVNVDLIRMAAGSDPIQVKKTSPRLSAASAGWLGEPPGARNSRLRPFGIKILRLPPSGHAQFCSLHVRVLQIRDGLRPSGGDRRISATHGGVSLSSFCFMFGYA